MMPKDSKTLREEFQYRTDVKVNKAILKNLRDNAIKFVRAVEILLEEMQSEE